MTYPQTPGFQNRTTSLDAALDIEPKVRGICLRILALLRTGPMTPDEAAASLRMSILSVRPRFTELYQQGLIDRLDERRRTFTGGTAHVYRLALPALAIPCEEPTP